MLEKVKPSADEDKQRLQDILSLLEIHYPLVRTKLLYNNPFQLFVAAVLSARTTDEQVNRVTAKLFAVAATPGQMANLEIRHLEKLLQGCGLYRNKSRYLAEASRRIVEEHGGQLPGTFEGLIALPGVGRKTANVILSGAYNQPALAVDTHVFRVSRRLGLARAGRPEKVEEEIKAQLPPESWAGLHHRLIAHGRQLCLARRPICPGCFLRLLCPWASDGETGRSKIREEEGKESELWPGKS